LILSLTVGTAVGIKEQIALAIGILLWVASWWVTECVPLGLAALIPPIIFSFTGILTWKDSLRYFMDPIIWVFMGGFVIAKAFQVWGLDKRIALKLAMLYKGNNPMIASLFVAAIPAFLLTMTGSITASTSIVYPIVLAFLTSIGIKKEGKYAEAMMLTLGQASTAGAMFLLISTPPNLIAKKVIEETLPNVKITFFDWFIIGTPHAIIGLLLSWYIIFKVIKPEPIDLEKARQKILNEVSKLGRLTKREKVVLYIFLQTMILWNLPGVLLILASVYPEVTSLASMISQILPEAAPAAIAILMLGLLQVEGRPLLTWKDIEEGIDWNVVFLFGGGIALGQGLKVSGFSQWIADFIINSLGLKIDFWTLIAVSAIIGFIITYPASNTASTIISAPLVASLAVGAGFNPIPPVLATALACSISSALPSTTPPMAIVYGSRYIKLWNMFKTGMVSDTIRLIILILLTPTLTALLCSIKGIPLYLTP
ncbi:MAG: hypothetical protein DRP08_06495, partial [Candidatus Aenigmatarchaeota archaeon]